MCWVRCWHCFYMNGVIPSWCDLFRKIAYVRHDCLSSVYHTWVLVISFGWVLTWHIGSINHLNSHVSWCWLYEKEHVTEGLEVPLQFTFVVGVFHSVLPMCSPKWWLSSGLLDHIRLTVPIHVFYASYHLFLTSVAYLCFFLEEKVICW